MMELLFEFQFNQDGLAMMILTGAIVLQLAHDFLDKGYLLFVDNYYNFVALATCITKMSTCKCVVPCSATEKATRIL